MKTLFHLARRILVPLAVLAGAVALAAGPAPGLFAPLEPLVVPLPPGERAITRLLPIDGGIYGIVARPGNRPVFLHVDEAVDGGVTLVDALPGIVLPPIEILTLPDLPWEWDAGRQQGYYLDERGHFRVYAGDGDATDLGAVAGTRPFEKNGFQISRALLRLPGGDVYAAGENGAIFRYSPGAGTLEKRTGRLPAVTGREPWASLDAAVAGPNGLIYGGTFDGYLFSYDPATDVVVNLGKPFHESRMQALTFRAGILYGIGGDPTGLPRVFAYDPGTHGFTLGGLLFGKPDPSLACIIYEPIGALAVDADGAVYLSSTGTIGELYRWKSSRK